MKKSTASRQPKIPAPPLSAPEVKRVSFEYNAPDAEEVFLAGTFNDWNPRSIPMTRQPDGRWFAERLLPTGHYEYRYVVDDQWRDDPKASEFVGNPFGSTNAVLTV